VLRKKYLNPHLQHNDYQVTNAHFRLGQALLKVGKTEEGQKGNKDCADLKSKAFKRDEAKVRLSPMRMSKANSPNWSCRKE
jgi:hypothetical protein